MAIHERVMGEQEQRGAHKRSSAGLAPLRLGCADGWGVGAARSWVSDTAYLDHEPQPNPEAPVSDAPEGPAVGSKVKIWWTRESRWFNGVVDDVKTQKNGRMLHHISYDDGDDQWHHLPSLHWVTTKSPNAASAASLGRKPWQPSKLASACTKKPRGAVRTRPIKIDRPGAREGEAWCSDDSNESEESLVEDATSLLSFFTRAAPDAQPLAPMRDAKANEAVHSEPEPVCVPCGQDVDMLPRQDFGMLPQCKREPRCTRGAGHKGWCNKRRLPVDYELPQTPPMAPLPSPPVAAPVDSAPPAAAPVPASAMAKASQANQCWRSPLCTNGFKHRGSCNKGKAGPAATGRSDSQHMQACLSLLELNSRPSCPVPIATVAAAFADALTRQNEPENGAVLSEPRQLSWTDRNEMVEAGEIA